MRTTQVWMLACGVLVGAGCDNNGGTDAGPGDAGGSDACATCVPDSGPRPDAGPTGDGNNSFATATALTLGTAASGAINPARDLDYYRFEGTAGQWIQIITEANPDDNPEMVDTVITVYDAAMNQIAENDDSQPRVNTDSELTMQLPATGTYYVLVQEFSTWTSATPEGMASFTYDLTVGELSTTAAAVNVDAEAGDDAASAQALRFATGTGGGTFSLIVGTFDGGTDIDVYSLTIPAGPIQNYSVYAMSGGTDGNGSTATPRAMWITNADGSEIIARIDPSQSEQIGPSLAEGTYLLFIENDGTAGTHDFYVLKAFRSGDNPAETMETENDAVATPEPITIGADPRSGFILATLGDADTDHFSFAIAATEAVTVVCGSRTLGSGVVGLTATLLDETGATTIATDTETATDGVVIEDAAVPSAGTYVLRLTKASQDAEVTGNFVRCGIHLAAP